MSWVQNIRDQARAESPIDPEIRYAIVSSIARYGIDEPEIKLRPIGEILGHLPRTPDDQLESYRDLGMTFEDLYRSHAAPEDLRQLLDELARIKTKGEEDSPNTRVRHQAAGEVAQLYVDIAAIVGERDPAQLRERIETNLNNHAQEQSLAELTVDSDKPRNR